MEPDLDVARRFLEANPPPGPVVLCAITGSHQYGFPSADSDLDIKGIHQLPTRRVLGLSQPPDAFDRLEVFEGTECDLTTHELGRALGLLLAGNGNLLERIFSPYQVHSPALDELRALVPSALSRACYTHYAGYFKGMRREHATKQRAKSMLYAYRVALTGIHLLRTGEVQAHLPTLMERYGFPELDALIEQKRTAETLPLEVAQSQRYEARWPELDAMLADARQNSVLPVDPPDRARVEGWLIDQRLTRV